MSKSEGEYSVPENCSFCGSPNIFLRNLVMSNDCIALQVWCNDCQKFRTLPKEENLRKKRLSGMQSKWALKVKERDNNTCVVCGSIEFVQAHHIIPVAHSEKYKYTVGNGVTLCKNCHYLVHYGENTQQ